MPTKIYDLKYVQAGIDEMETYLVSKNLFYPLHILSPPGEPANPRLTLGSLVLALARLHAREEDQRQDAHVRSLETALDRWRIGWMSSWKKKAKREIHSRLRQWRLYLQDVLQAPQAQIVFYPSEVRVRVIIDLLKAEIDPPDSSLVEELEALDQTLRSIHLSGEFIWDADLAPGFRPEPYWYLWGKPNFELLTPG